MSGTRLARAIATATADASAQGVDRPRTRCIPRWQLKPGDVLVDGRTVIPPIDTDDGRRFIRVRRGRTYDYLPLMDGRRLSPTWIRIP